MGGRLSKASTKDAPKAVEETLTIVEVSVCDCQRDSQLQCTASAPVMRACAVGVSIEQATY
jgi:hypothetical protein